jgi:hypothetical protein
MPCPGVDWMEHVYDGYDLTQLVNTSCPAGEPISVFVSGYGLVQPPWITPGHSQRKKKKKIKIRNH